MRFRYRLYIMIVCIHQPHYWPWLGLLDKIAKSELLIILDHVDIMRQSNQYRNIFFSGGKEKYLTIPMEKTSRMPLNEINFKSESWRSHPEELEKLYKKALYWNEISPLLKQVYEKRYDRPLDLILESMRVAMDIFEIETKIILSSELRPNQRKGHMILELLSSVNAERYLAGRGSQEYMQEVAEDFKAAGIETGWQNFTHPVYEQVPGQDFVPGLSCLDMAFFQGIQGARRIFKQNKVIDEWS
jgi:hypothetical protein